MIGRDAREAGPMDAQGLAADRVIPVDAIQGPQRQQGGVRQAPPQARELPPQRAPHSTRGEPLVQVTVDNLRARAVIPQDVALDQPLHLLRALAPSKAQVDVEDVQYMVCLLYTSPSPRDLSTSRMPSSA